MTEQQIINANFLWSHGYNTHQIAVALDLEESTIYNSMRQIKRSGLKVAV